MNQINNHYRRFQTQQLRLSWLKVRLIQDNPHFSDTLCAKRKIFLVNRDRRREREGREVSDADVANLFDENDNTIPAENHKISEYRDPVTDIISADRHARDEYVKLEPVQQRLSA